ncbi:hypothetical protein B0H16DRAFT_1460623 [Mycena metata]|uniref:BTB domain-containing protein n=1 Tax=Mycena metata TaxID=1033252 RepID=A0AAD7IJF8_9AGAR|nr:hypothetical protein B0H16DRAFT_1727144 [Mycena metata]KAJ7750516.1 hypothetical protein B0H16DRAFT_1460623 [Mycena metata]
MSASTEIVEVLPDGDVFIPAYPFSPSPIADTILRSSDGVDFYVLRGVLSLVSSIFETMFRLPQPDGAPAIPIVDLQENSAVLDRALRFFYPGTRLTVATLEELGEILEVLVSKYDIQSVLETAKQHVKPYIVSRPLAVYAIAFAHRWEDVGLLAARECLKLPLRVPDPPAPPELAYLTSTAYYNLLCYHLHCAEAVRKIAQDMSWIKDPRCFCWFDCGTCPQNPTLVHTGRWCRLWFMQFFNAMADLQAVTPRIELGLQPLIFEAMGKAADCDGRCRTKAPPDLHNFITNIWAPKIEEEISKVEWKF